MWISHSPWLREVRQRLNADPEAGTVGVMLPTGLLPGSCSASFHIQPRPTCLIQHFLINTSNLRVLFSFPADLCLPNPHCTGITHVTNSLACTVHPFTSFCSGGISIYLLKLGLPSLRITPEHKGGSSWKYDTGIKEQFGYPLLMIF